MMHRRYLAGFLYQGTIRLCQPVKAYRFRYAFTERQTCLLYTSPLQVQLTFLQTKTHDTTHTPQEHMKAFYKTFDAVRNERFDGMIITGAPIEDLDYEDVDYWNELCEIMDYSRENVYSTIHLCWGCLLYTSRCV